MAISEKKVAVISRTLIDLGKGLVLLGVASYAFEKLPFFWRVTTGILSVALVFTGIWMHPGGKE